MPILISRNYTWAETEAADAFVASAESRQMSPKDMRLIAQLADDTDEAVAIWEFIDGLRRTDRADRR